MDRARHDYSIIQLMHRLIIRVLSFRLLNTRPCQARGQWIAHLGSLAIQFAAGCCSCTIETSVMILMISRDCRGCFSPRILLYLSTVQTAVPMLGRFEDS